MESVRPAPVKRWPQLMAKQPKNRVNLRSDSGACDSPLLGKLSETLFAFLSRVQRAR